MLKRRNAQWEQAEYILKGRCVVLEMKFKLRIEKISIFNEAIIQTQIFVFPQLNKQAENKVPRTLFGIVRNCVAL